MRLLMLLLFFSSAMYCQEQVDRFELLPTGFPNYVVLEFEDKTANDIFTQVKRWAEFNIRNADYSNYSELKNEYLSYTINYTDAFKANDVINKQYFDVLTDVELRFKDGKLRIDLHLKSITGKSGWNVSPSGGMTSVYKKNGNVRKQRVYREILEGMNTWSNSIVTAFVNAVKGNVDYKKDDW